MNWWMLITPFIAAVLGWLLVSAALQLVFHPLSAKKIAGFKVQGILPGRQKELAATIGRLSASFFSIQELEEKITNADNVKKIMPHAEAHIDHFLRVKLVKSMPVVGMFVGDKTINGLKSLFMTELEELFPEIMKNYIDGLQDDFNIEQLVSSKIAGIPPANIEKAFFMTMKKELSRVKQLGALLGFTIGCIQLAVLFFFH